MALTDASEGESPKVLSGAYARQAEADRAEALKYAKRHRAWHVCVGLSAVCFGATAGSLGALKLAAWSAIAGIFAAISAGAQAFLKAPVLARFHFEQAASYGALARRFQLLAIGPDEPTSEQIERLIEQWQEIQARFPEDLSNSSSQA
jgi:hypothetical protein